MHDDQAYLHAPGAIVLRPATAMPEGGWGELAVNVLGDLRRLPTEISAGSLQIPADALGEVTRQAIVVWLRVNAAREWKVIHDYMVQARGGLIVFDWEDAESFGLFLELMGFGRPE